MEQRKILKRSMKREKKWNREHRRIIQMEQEATVTEEQGAKYQKEQEKIVRGARSI